MKTIKEFRWVLIGFVSLVLFYAVLLILVPTNTDNQLKESRESLATPSTNATAVVSQYTFLTEKSTNKIRVSWVKQNDLKPPQLPLLMMD
jgi:hypothetical protein